MIKKYTIKLPEGYEPPPMEIRDRLCNALQSGMYSQGTGVLLRVFSRRSYYCCLGVATAMLTDKKDWDIIKPDQPIGVNDSNVIVSMYGSDCSVSEDNPVHPYLASEGYLPDGVMITYADGLNEANNVNSLALMNDRGFTFDQIARIIKVIWSQPQH